MTVQREWIDKDYYKVLGVSKSAPEKEITRAYRKLAKQHHPDANAGNKTAEEKFKDVSTAYDVLGDASKRKEYDEVRQMSGSGMGFGGGGNPFAGGGGAGAGTRQGPPPGNFRFEDLGDLFGGLFNRGQRSGPSAQRGEDLETSLTLSFDDAINGITTSVNVSVEAQCDSCHGSGSKPGTSPLICPMCHGRGALDDDQGPFSLNRPCPQCHGNGRVIKDPCPACLGTRVQRRNRRINVRIPAGVTDGQRIRLKERGGPGRNGGTFGDLYVVVKVGAHKLFGRKGNDLLLTVPVTYSELVLGAAITVPTIGGRVTVKVPEGSQSGRKLRVRGHGAETKKGAGDLIVTFEVAIPKNPSAAERNAIETLADNEDGDRLRAHLGEK